MNFIKTQAIKPTYKAHLLTMNWKIHKFRNQSLNTIATKLNILKINLI